MILRRAPAGYEPLTRARGITQAEFLTDVWTCARAGVRLVRVRALTPGGRNLPLTMAPLWVLSVLALTQSGGPAARRCLARGVRDPAWVAALRAAHAMGATDAQYTFLLATAAGDL